MLLRNTTTQASLVCCLCSMMTASVRAECIDGICFVDRGLSGEIDLGSLGGNITVIDYDNDGFPDLVVGERAGRMNKIFHNEPALGGGAGRTFVDVTTGSGLDDSDNVDRWAAGILVADYDNDGDSDVYITGWRDSDESHGVLYQNNGGTFSNVSVAAGIRATVARPISASWNDFDLDGNIDLLVAFWEGGTSNLLLWHNQGNGTFADASDLLPQVAFSTAYSNLWMDYDEDGYADCFILSNSGDDVLLKNVDDGQGGRMFINAAGAVGYTGLGAAPMGIATGDFDNDGDFDLGVSNAFEGTYYENQDGSFVKIFPFDSIWGWGVAWVDVDNDADLDFYMAGSFAQQSNFDKLFRNLGGSFDDVSPALNGASAPSRFSVQLDFNNDGRQDLITVNPDIFISIYDNVSTTGGNWLTLQLSGDRDRINGDAIGAVVRLTAGGLTQLRQVISGSSTTSTEDLRVHFGLGDISTVDQIEVLWPAQGTLLERTDIFPGPFAANQILALEPVLPDRPESFNVVLGEYQTGEVSDLFFSDDSHVVIGQRAALTPLLPLIRLEIEGTASSPTASELSVTAEAATTAIPSQPVQKLSLFNSDGGTWEVVDERTATLDDSIVEVTIDANAQRFIEPGTNVMQARLEWFNPGDVFFLAWGVRVDQLVWEVTP